MELKKHFITTCRPYKEGTVEVFQQKLKYDNIIKATLTITALGLYEAEINDKKVGDALFTPGFTYYPTHLYYQTYDVTEMLTAGRQVVLEKQDDGYWHCIGMGTGGYRLPDRYY